MSKSRKVTVPSLKEMKDRSEKIAMLTAYDYGWARLLDSAGVDVLLVGDSLGMVVLGYENTLPVTMEDMIRHTAAVARGTERALVVADMPFMSYQVSTAQAVENAGRLVKEGNAECVKLEGGQESCQAITSIITAGIPVMGHIGLTPQSVHKLGGYRVQGRGESGARLRQDAIALQEAGVFALVLESVPASLAAQITQELTIPTIGIGAGNGCDGQVLVTHDMTGMFDRFTPKFVKQYSDTGGSIRKAAAAYVEEVKQGDFPGEEHSFQ